VIGALVASGGALRWFRDQLGESERLEAARLGIDPFDLLSKAADQSPPGANRLVFLPYMYGERSPIWDSDARGVFFGLSLATQKADMVRAIMEGAASGCGIIWMSPGQPVFLHQTWPVSVAERAVRSGIRSRRMY
jgi:xylulokinase